MDNDGFTFVKKKTKIRKKGTPHIDTFSEQSVKATLDRIHFPPMDFQTKIPKIPIICYGLGSLSYRSSIIQLKFLLDLQPSFPSISLYDPISTPEEIQFFQSLGFHWINYTPQNEHVLYFMVHCEHSMYHDIINNSNNFFLIGNRLKDYQFDCETIEIDFGEYGIDFYGTCLHIVRETFQ
jgi:hypothetical protein